MEKIKTTKQESSGFIICVFCKKIIRNNSFRASVIICEKNNFFHSECYEKSVGEVDIDKIIEDYDKARRKENSVIFK